MKSPRTLATAAAAAVLLMMLSACSTTPLEVEETSVASPGDDMSILAVESACDGDEGVTVVTDASTLGDADEASATWCVFADEPIAASAAIAAANLTTEGTQEYGDQVVCRVNGVPGADLALTAEDGSEYFEACASMPAAFAYWSLWVRPTGREWAYAEEGLSTLQLQPGQSLGLLFTLNGEPAAPTP